MIGLDTGFFIKFLENNAEAVRVWKKIVDCEEAVVSCLTMFELKRLSLKGLIDKDSINVIMDAVTSICKISWLAEKNLLLQGANISHGLGIPAVDALILAGFIDEGVNNVYTTDSHFESYKKKGVSIIKL